MSLIYKKIHLFLSMCLPVCACTHVRLEVLCRYPGTGVTWVMKIELQSSDGAVSTFNCWATSPNCKSTLNPMESRTAQLLAGLKGTSEGKLPHSTRYLSSKVLWSSSTLWSFGGYRSQKPKLWVSRDPASSRRTPGLKGSSFTNNTAVGGRQRRYRGQLRGWP